MPTVALRGHVVSGVGILLMAAVPPMAGSGRTLAVQAGLLPGFVVGASGMPLPESFAGFRPRAAHGFPASLLAALVAILVPAARWHQRVRRDGLLGRMVLGRPR